MLNRNQFCFPSQLSLPKQQSGVNHVGLCDQERNHRRRHRRRTLPGRCRRQGRTHRGGRQGRRACERNHRRHRSGGVAGVCRYPHPLRRADILGPGAEPILLSRRHQRVCRQLRLLGRAPHRRRRRLPDENAGPRRGHAVAEPARWRALELDLVRELPGTRRGAPAGGERRLSRRSLGAAARGDGRSGGGSGRQPGSACGNAKTAASVARRRRHGLFLVPGTDPQRRRRPPGALPRRDQPGVDRAEPLPARSPRHPARIHSDGRAV